MVAAYKKLSRRQVRYWLFRFKTEAGSRTELPGASAKGAPRGLRQHFEAHCHFLGWPLFNETGGWDVDEVDPLRIVPLRRGSDDLWNDVVEEEAREFPLAAVTDAAEDEVGDGG